MSNERRIISSKSQNLDFEHLPLDVLRPFSNVGRTSCDTSNVVNLKITLFANRSFKLAPSSSTLRDLKLYGIERFGI